MKRDYLIAIKNDLFDIADRLKSVNASYRVYYNNVKNRYEVHSERRCGNDGNTIAFVVPYKQLDARTVEYARKTSVANIERLLAETERHNKEIEKQTENQIANQACKNIENIFCGKSN